MLLSNAYLYRVPCVHGLLLSHQEPRQIHSPLTDLKFNKKKKKKKNDEENNYDFSIILTLGQNNDIILDVKDEVFSQGKRRVFFLPSRPRLMPLPLLVDPPRPRLASRSPFFSLLSFISEGPPSFPRLRFFPTVSQEV